MEELTAVDISPVKKNPRGKFVGCQQKKIIINLYKSKMIEQANMPVEQKLKYKDLIKLMSKEIGIGQRTITTTISEYKKKGYHLDTQPGCITEFEADIFGINCNNFNNTGNNFNKVNSQYHNFQHYPLNMALSKEIDSVLLQNQYASTLIPKTKSKSLISKTELNNKANLAIAAAGCASSSPKIFKAKKKKNLRKAAGKVWNDPTMDQWPSDDFRLFVGNLGKEVNDHMLSVPFLQYPSFIKARVVKNRETSMSRGCYGFVSFRDSADYLQAMKELQGKYVGSRPMKIVKSNWKKRNIETKV